MPASSLGFDLMAIPAKLHFCWIGPGLPWAYVFGILSAVERSGIADVVLHHTDTLEDGETLRLLHSVRGVSLQKIDPRAYLLQAGRAIGLADQLDQLYTALERVVMRADLLRAAILYMEGGVYLDLDTVTVASLTPLLATEVFVGSEFIVWPHHVRQSRSPFLWARHLMLDVIRKLCRRAPRGWQMFRLLENLYVRQVNNAVMGAAAHSAFFSDYLHAMAALTIGQRANRTALGPGLLQKIADEHCGRPIELHKPNVFSPLPPEVSQHWFRVTRAPGLSAVLLPETRVVHWYASVRTTHLVEQINPAYILENRHHQLYSALVYDCVGNSIGFESVCCPDRPR